MFVCNLVLSIIELMSKKQQKQKVEEKPTEQETQEPQVAKQSVLKPLQVQYCPKCTLPFEYCDFGGKYQKCIDWRTKHRPELLPKEGEKPEGSQNKPEKAQKQEVEEKKQKSSKPKKYIVYEISDRTKKKHITTISGLQAYGINSKQFAKKCSKKFACSCNSVNEDKVQIQGDISEVLVDFMQKEFEVKQKYIVDIDTYKKKMEKEQKKNPKKDKGGDQKEETKPEPKVETEGAKKDTPQDA